jgi:hypothetical protein
MALAFVNLDTSFGLETNAAMLARMRNLSWRGEKHANEFAASEGL